MLVYIFYNLIFSSVRNRNYVFVCVQLTSTTSREGGKAAACVFVLRRIFALKQGFCLVKAKEDLYFLNDLIKSLQTKLKFPSLKGISNKIDDAQHYIQSVAKHLHDWADSEDDSKHHNKYFVVKAYHSAYIHAKLMAAYVQNCLNQDVSSSVLNQAKEVLNSYLKETLKYHKAEGTIDHNNPDVVVELVAHFVKSLTSSEKDEKDNRDKIATEEMLKTVREILSLLTPSNFEEQLARIKTLVIDSEDQLAEVTDLFFEKRTNGCEKEKKKRVTAARKTTSPVARPVQNAVIEPEIKQVSTPEMDIQIKEMPNLLPVVTQTAVEKPVIAAEAEPGITNKKQESSLSPSVMQLRLTRRNNISFDCRPRRPGIQHSLPMAFKPSPTTATDDGEVLLKSSSLKYTYRDDQWSPFNPEGKKTYDRNFILELRNNPASRNKPECLSSLNFGEILPKKSLLNMRFIGELFKLEILSLDSLHYIILRLLGRPEDETSLECLCVLLTAIGKQLETPAMQTPDEESASSSSVRSPLDLSRYKSSNC
uniref:Uncharacterized protein n=1 Tax=Daphnia galeata TaxID=27404 RepID=A0A8J2WCD7_9CRUS|nr:unnamed protein product [Daphnia galeata]